MVRSIHRRDQMIEDAKTGVSEPDSARQSDYADPDQAEPSRTTSVAVWFVRISLLALPLLALAVILMQ